MTVKTFHQRLTGQVFPKAWHKLAGFDVAAETPFILDIVPIGDFLHVYVSSRVLIDGFQDRLKFKEGQDNLPVETMRPVPRGLDITLVRKNAHTAQNIAIELDGKPVELEITPNLSEEFSGLNTAFLSEVEPDTNEHSI